MNPNVAFSGMRRISLVIAVLLTSCATPPLKIHDPITHESQTISALEFGLALGYISQEIAPLIRTYFSAHGNVPASLTELQSFTGHGYPLPLEKRFCAIDSNASGERVSITLRMLYPHKSGDNIIGEGRNGCSDPVSVVVALTDEQLARDRAIGKSVHSRVEIARD